VAGNKPVSFLNREISKQLAQSRPSGTSAASIYAPANNVTGVIKMIKVVNTTGTAATFKLFHDQDGTTYSEETALEWSTSVAANATWQNDCFIAVKNSGNFAVSTATGSALTFTLYGIEIT